MTDPHYLSLRMNSVTNTNSQSVNSFFTKPLHFKSDIKINSKFQCPQSLNPQSSINPQRNNDTQNITSLTTTHNWDHQRIHHSRTNCGTLILFYSIISINKVLLIFRFLLFGCNKYAYNNRFSLSRAFK